MAKEQAIGNSPKNESTNLREKWKKNIDFVFSIAGGFVGLGNVWRFPYLCYENGGGAFLIPYFLCVVTCSLPVFFLEVIIGQYTNMGSSLAFNCVPFMKGIGIAVNIINFHLNTYYAVILAWSARYFFASMNEVLPWASCDNDFNTESCFVFGTKPENVTSKPSSNLTATVSVATLSNVSSTVSSVEEFWQRGVLAKSSGLENIGSIQWELLLCLLLTWIIMYFCIWKGIGWTSKVVYFTATFPLLLLFVLLIRGLTLPGAMDGVSYYLRPNTTKLLETKVWLDAANQVFFSYALCKGMIITMGSYNGYKYNSYRDCILLSCLNSGVSIISGFAIFSVLGFMANEQNVTVAEVTKSGPGLAFIAYPKALTLMPWPQFWGCVFFFMLFLLGLDSEFVGLETLIAAFVDLYPAWFKKKWRREMVLAFLCLIQFAIGISMVTNGGIYVFQMFDKHAAAGWCLLFLGCAQCVCMAWFFGIDKLWTSVIDMIGFEPTIPWFKWTWMWICPICTTLLMVVSLCFYKPLKYESFDFTYIYPDWGLVICWLLTLSSVMWVPGYALFYFLWKTKGDLKQRWMQCVTSKEEAVKTLKGDGTEMEEMEPFYKEEILGDGETHNLKAINPPKYDDLTRSV